MRRGHGAVGWLATIGIVLGLSPVARAGAHPHDRNGFVIGFGVGGGSMGIEDADEREGSVIGNFRIGYAVRPDLVLQFEGSGWTKTFEDPVGDLTWTFSAGTAALTWFPGNVGGWLRGGVGGGTASVELETGGFRITDDESGFAVLAGAGYEWRLTRMFALGPHAEFFWMDLDEVGSADMFGGALDFNWYW
jgi:hypothetical protein